MNLEFFGLEMQQAPEALPSFNKLLDNFKPKRIIEMGTGLGGLTTLFGIWGYMNDCSVFSCDVQFRDIRTIELIKKIGVQFEHLDIYNTYDQYRLSSYIRWSNGPVLLICDAAEKPISFAQYAKYLRQGDIIMAHDYYKDLDDFKKIYHNYTAFETSEDSIKDVCKEYDLVNHPMQEEFRISGWAIRIKN